MNRVTLWIVVLSVCAFGVAGCGGSSAHLAVALGTTPSTLAVNTGGTVVATVVHDPNNAGVTWSCMPAVACGLFSFAPASTSSAGTAVFTAPPAIPVGGQVTITATSITNTARSASTTITITGSATPTNNFVFYASGEEASGNTYSVAGVVAISTDGNNTIIGGEQDYNDGMVTTSLQPSGDFITSGSLAFAGDGSGNATLTLVTNNPNVGVSGTETFALSYANADHALIIQFDGSATSFGSLDLQTSAATPVGASFSFTDTGADGNGMPIADGGVFTLDGSSNITGFYDTNDAGAPVLDTPIPSGVSAGPTDSLGRGNIIGGLAEAIFSNYYVVGPEALRIIDVDPTDTAAGSAYGQGATPAFSAASIGTSVFNVGSSLGLYAAAGQFTTDGSGNITDGTGDENESVLNGTAPVTGATPLTGTYALAADGYGSINFTSANLNSVSVLGVYAVDPTLNILDPNNPVGSGGALIAEMDSLVGIGALIPQTDAALGDVTSPVTFGAQGRTNTDGVGNDEFDFIGQGPFSGGLNNATGALSDPLGALTETAGEFNATFNGAFTDDGTGVGRSTAILTVSATDGTDFTAVPLTVTAYEANPNQLLWIETDDTSFFNGSIQGGEFDGGDARPAKPRPNARKQ